MSKKKPIHIPNQSFNKRFSDSAVPLETMHQYNLLNDQMKKQAKRLGHNTKNKANRVCKKNLPQKKS